MKKQLALLCALVMILGVAAGCTGPANGNDPSAGNNGGSTGPDGRTRSAEQTYRMLYNSEVSTLNYLYSASEVDHTFGANCVEALVSSDRYGNLQPAAATSWEVSADGLTWTLKIREGMKWYDYTGAEKGEVTAEDWVTGAEWVLNAANDSSNSHMMKGYIAGAQEYYDYTSAIVKGETPAEAVSADSIGVKAIDKYTLQYTLTQPRVYFLSLLEFGCYYPMSAACVEENGADLGIDNTRMWYCGAYLMDEFAPQQIHVYVKNPNYWDAENVHIERVERKYNAEAGTLAPTMFLNGEIDYTEISSDLLAEWLANETTAKLVSPTMKRTNYSYYFGFNFEPMFDEQYEPDNWRIAVNNENFRKSIYHGLDRIRALQVEFPSSANDMVSNSITPSGFARNGNKDYTTYGDLAKITETDSFNEKLALEYKAKAVEEMTAAGATFPVKILMQYNGDATWAKECLVMKQQLEALLGADYIEIIINNFGAQNFLSGTRRCGNYAMQRLNGGAGYVDPETWLFMTQKGNNYTFAFDTTEVFEKSTKSAETTAIVEKYYELIEKAKLETIDVDARYTAFANAEAYYIDHAMVIPYRASGGIYNGTKLNPFEGVYSSCGWGYLKYKGLYVYDTAMSGDMFSSQLASWEAARGE